MKKKRLFGFMVLAFVAFTTVVFAQTITTTLTLLQYNSDFVGSWKNLENKNQQLSFHWTLIEKGDISGTPYMNITIEKQSSQSEYEPFKLEVSTDATFSNVMYNNYGAGKYRWHFQNGVGGKITGKFKADPLTIYSTN